MLIIKMGTEHITYGTNCQDYGLENDHLLCVVDGCGEGKHSEIGSKLFIKKIEDYLISKPSNLHSVFKKIDFVSPKMMEYFFKGVMHAVISSGASKRQIANDIREYLSFTIMVLKEYNDVWKGIVYGDGYLILENEKHEIEFREFPHQEYPSYIAYKYIDKAFLTETIPDITPQQFTLAKKDYQGVGVASDGLRYVIGTPFESDVKKYLLDNKEVKIKLLINKLNLQYQKGGGFFKDDITIAFKHGGDK